MKKVAVSIAAAMLSLGCLQGAWADDDAPKHSVAMTTVLQTLQDEGYVLLKGVEYDDGVFEAEGINDEGQLVKARIDPHTGKIITPDHSRMENTEALVEVVKKVNQAGYRPVYSIEREPEGYEVHARDDNNNTVELKVNENGEVQHTES